MIMLLNFIALPNLDDWTKKIKDCIFCSQQFWITFQPFCFFVIWYVVPVRFFFRSIIFFRSILAICSIFSPKANIVKILRKSSWFLYCSLLSNSSASALLWCSCRSKVAVHPPFCYPISYILLLACRTRIAWNQNYFLPEGASFSTKLSGSCY